MAKEENNSLFRFVDIPPLFYSDLTGEPFQNCIKCDKDIIKEGEMYLIEKAFTQTLSHQTRSTLFEYAICHSCWETTRKSLSVESMQNIEQFFSQRVDFGSRQEKLFGKQDEIEINDWISNCIVDGSPVEELKEFQVACQCIGNFLLVDQLPYMIGSIAIEEIQELISEKTRDEMEGFKKRLTSPSPDMEELFDRKKLLVI